MPSLPSFGRKKLKLGAVPDPDDDLASTAGFEIKEAATGFLSIFRLNWEREAWTVEEVKPSSRPRDHQKQPQGLDTTLDSADVSEMGEKSSVGSEGATDEENDEESNNGTAGEDKVASVAAVGCCAVMSTKAKGVVEGIRLKVKNFMADEKMRKRYTSPLALFIYFIILLALFLGLIFGLKDRENAPPAVVGPPPPSINILIEFDDNPEEVGWSIIDQDSWGVLSEMKEGSYDASSRFINEEVELEYDKEYIFRMSDAGMDGLSAGSGGKWLLVYKNTEFMGCTGNYGGADIVVFVIKENEELPSITSQGRCSSI
jgi:hypothetical protein